MQKTARPNSFVLCASDHGMMIVNRHDYGKIDGAAAFGVGFQILQTGRYEEKEVEILSSLLQMRRHHFGDGVVALDCGANIGALTVEMAKVSAGWGTVIAVEAQERIFYALAGNICINNCVNARAINAALGSEEGSIRIPIPNYLMPGNFGGLELRVSQSNEFIGQPIDYLGAATQEIRLITIDGLDLPRIDLIKIDVEGMEDEVLLGATQTITDKTPLIVVEYGKTSWNVLESRLSCFGYKVFRTPMNMIAVHSLDPTINGIVQR